MRTITARAISIRAAAFLLTLIVAVGLVVSRDQYVHRQAHFVDAAFLGRPFQMKALYKLGVDVNAPGCEYRLCINAIWGAAYGGYDDQIQFLLDRGADVNIKPKFGTTPLMVAAHNGHESTVRLLLSKGADVNANIEGDTALSFAKAKSHPRIVELLRQGGARDTP